MTDHTSTGSCASRWDALLAENSILDKEHIDLLSSYTPPFSAQQIAQLEASAARRAELQRRSESLSRNGRDRHPCDDHKALEIRRLEADFIIGTSSHSDVVVMSSDKSQCLLSLSALLVDAI
jgi:hypothetical protein